METTNLLRLINTLIALLTIPPAVGVLLHVISESKIIPKATTSVNYLLRITFGAIAIASVFNALLSFLLLIGYDFTPWGQYAQYLYNGRNLIQNGGAFITSWGFWVIINRAKREE